MIYQTAMRLGLLNQLGLF